MTVDVSPDGKTLVFDLLGHVYTIPVDGGDARVLTGDSGVAVNFQPAYSPDGSRIAFISDRSGQNNLWIMDADGRNPRIIEQNLEVRHSLPRFTSDGRFIVARRSALGEERRGQRNLDVRRGRRAWRGADASGRPQQRHRAEPEHRRPLRVLHHRSAGRGRSGQGQDTAAPARSLDGRCAPRDRRDRAWARRRRQIVERRRIRAAALARRPAGCLWPPARVGHHFLQGEAARAAHRVVAARHANRRRAAAGGSGRARSAAERQRLDRLPSGLRVESRRHANLHRTRWTTEARRRCLGQGGRDSVQGPRPADHLADGLQGCGPGRSEATRGPIPAMAACVGRRRARGRAGCGCALDDGLARADRRSASFHHRSHDTSTRRPGRPTADRSRSPAGRTKSAGICGASTRLLALPYS